MSSEVPWNKLKHYPSFLFLIGYLVFIEHNVSTQNIVLKFISGLIISGVMIYSDYYFDIERKKKAYSALGSWYPEDPELDKPNTEQYFIWFVLVVFYGFILSVT